MDAKNLIDDLNKYSSPKDAQFLQRFFKTGTGQYGEGDIFIGVRMPSLRIIAKKYKNLSLGELQKLLDSQVHEHRMVALLILTLKFPKATDQKSIYNFYLTNLYKGNINNWDLIDVTTPRIMGAYLLDRKRDILYELAKSSDLWQKRASILTTFRFIKNSDYETSIDLAHILLNDQHDLIHKAVGWMLREIGKHDEDLLKRFLDDHSQDMPRTMLRYSIERLPSQKRFYYMQNKSQHKN